MGNTSGNNGALLAYQRAAAESVARELCERSRAVVVAPPRTGKLLIVASALETRPRRETLVLTPSVEAFQRRLSRLPEPLRSHMSEGRIVAYARVASMDEGPLRRLWKSRIILDSFQRCGSERWGEAVRKLIDDPRGAEVIGISAYSIRPSDDGRDMVRELFGGRYAFHMELTDAWTSPDVPLEPPTFVEAFLSWDDDLAGLRSRASGVVSAAARKKVQEGLAELEAALDHLGRSDGEVLEHIPRADGHYVVFCSRVADVDPVRDRLVGWLGTVNGRVVSYQATYDIGFEQARKAISAYSANHSDALKLLFVIDKLRDWGEVPCDGAFCFRRTRSVNVLAGQIAQASRLAGSGESVFVDLAGNLESAGVWEGRKRGGREEDGTTKALLDYVSGHIVITERSMRATELLRKMDALLSGCGAKSGGPAPTGSKWSREEDIALTNHYISYGLKWDGWGKVLPGRSIREIEKRAFILNVKFGMPARWSDQDDKNLREHYQTRGSEWEGWLQILPGKTRAQISTRASQLELIEPFVARESGAHANSNGNAATDKRGSKAGAKTEQVRHQAKSGWTKEAEQMFEYLYGPDAPQTPASSSSKDASKKEIKRFAVWARGLRPKQLEWLDDAVRNLYPMLGREWEGWKLLIPSAGPVAIRSRARTLKVRDEWHRILKQAKRLGWNEAECAILRAEYTLYSEDSGYWNTKLPNRSSAEVSEMARQLHLPSWQDVLSIAEKGIQLGVKDIGLL